MTRGTVLLTASLLSFAVSIAHANSDAIKTSGNVRITGSGSGLVFADGSTQTTAAVSTPPTTLAIGTVATGAPGSSASATITGTAPSLTLNLGIPQGASGPPGPATACPSIKMLFTHMTIFTTIPATATTNAYNTVSDVRNIHASDGKATGWVQKVVNGSSSGGATTAYQSGAYLTAWDAHGGGTDGNAYMTPKASYRITNSYTYDSDGNRTQRVRTYYNADDSVFRVQTTNYGPNFSYLSETSAITGSPTTTTTYSNTIFDSNGYPWKSDLISTDGVGATTGTGTALYEFTPICVQ